MFPKSTKSSFSPTPKYKSIIKSTWFEAFILLHFSLNSLWCKFTSKVEVCIDWNVKPLCWIKCKSFLIGRHDESCWHMHQWCSILKVFPLIWILRVGKDNISQRLSHKIIPLSSSEWSSGVHSERYVLERYTAPQIETLNGFYTESIFRCASIS